jgi:hypothetical protein
VEIIQESNDVFLFQDIFCGNINAFGQHQPTKKIIKAGEKLRGDSWTVREQLTIDHYKKHLNGECGLGVVPLNIQNKVKFIAIDIDNYDEKYINQMTKKVYNNRLPFLPFRSKSGGLHLYLFFKEFIEYSKIKEGLLEFLPVLGLKNNVEIFPKQKTLKEDQIGNWINLPYFNAKETKQVLIDENYNILTLTQALSYIKNKAIELDEFLLSIENLYLNDSPPCIQAIYYNEDTEQRNEFLFNAAVYFKSKFGEDFEYELKELNKDLVRPLEEKEIEETIIKSHKKRDYSYKCNQLPCSEFCLKETCRKRKFGVGSEEISELSFEEFIQHKSDPPYYEWIVNGKNLIFYQENDIIKQDKFRELCFRELHLLPSKLKDTSWTKIINRALKNIVIKEIAIEDDMSPGSMFMANLYDFLENRVHAENLSQILIDRVFKEETLQYYVFKSKNLIDFLFIQKGFKIFKATEIQNRLKRLGALVDRLYIDKNNKGIRVWKLPYKAIENLKVHVESGFEIDFTNYNKEIKGENNEEEMY